MTVKGRCVWLIASAVLTPALILLSSHNAEAVIEPIYTLPLYDNYRITQGFIPGSHNAIDYEIVVYGAGGEPIAAAASGTAKPCPFDFDGAGNYMVIDHGNGHRTRYLHLRDPALPSNGQIVSRGDVIGYEGSTGFTDPPGFNHLHFETRHAATTFTCGFDGTAVDPYDSATYMWTTNPPQSCPGGGPWSGWGSLGGSLTSAPAAVSWGCNRLDVFALGANNDLVHKSLDGTWSGWETLGGSLTSTPAAVTWGANRLDVFALGASNDLVHQSWDGAWSGWETLGGCVSAAPSAVSWGADRLDVFVRGCDNALYWNAWDGTWSGWQNLGGVLASAPAVVSWAPNRLDIFALGAGNDLVHQSW